MIEIHSFFYFCPSTYVVGLLFYEGALPAEGASRTARILVEFRHWVLHAHALAVSNARRAARASPPALLGFEVWCS